MNHPIRWQHRGYREIQNPPERYALAKKLQEDWYNARTKLIASAEKMLNAKEFARAAP